MLNMEDLYRLLRTGDVQAQGIVDTIANPLLVLDESLCVQSASHAFFETFKVNRYDTIGRPIYELGSGQWDIPELRRLLVEVIPKSAAVINYEVEHDFPRSRPKDDARDGPHAAPSREQQPLHVAVVRERDRKVPAGCGEEPVVGELRHRMKNLLAVTRPIARLTTTQERSTEEYRDDFLGRFGALVEAQDLAFGGEEEATLAALLKRILAPYAAKPDTVVIDLGANVQLEPAAVAEALKALDVPFAVASAYDNPEDIGGQVLAGAPNVGKPTDELRLFTAIEQLYAYPARLNWGSPVPKQD